MAKKTRKGVLPAKKNLVERGLSNHDINRILQDEKDYMGCYMRDEKLPKYGCFVLNLDEFVNPGTHWVAVYHNEYYDSYGLPPPKCLESRIDWYNTRQHQSVNTSLCGLYACYYIKCRNRNNSPYSICFEKLKMGGDNFVEICRRLDKKDRK